MDFLTGQVGNQDRLGDTPPTADPDCVDGAGAQPSPRLVFAEPQDFSDVM